MTIKSRRNFTYLIIILGVLVILVAVSTLFDPFRSHGTISVVVVGKIRAQISNLRMGGDVVGELEISQLLNRIQSKEYPFQIIADSTDRPANVFGAIHFMHDNEEILCLNLVAQNGYVVDSVGGITRLGSMEEISRALGDRPKKSIWLISQ